ncbi:MAG: hypothetical protein ABGW75_02220, partial [Pirellulales bacterium]
IEDTLVVPGSRGWLNPVREVNEGEKLSGFIQLMIVKICGYSSGVTWHSIYIKSRNIFGAS